MMTDKTISVPTESRQPDTEKVADRLIRKIVHAAFELAEARWLEISEESNGMGNRVEMADDIVKCLNGEEIGCLDPDDEEDAAKIQQFLNECVSEIRAYAAAASSSLLPVRPTISDLARTLEQEWVKQESRTTMLDRNAKIQFESSIFTRMAEAVASLPVGESQKLVCKCGHTEQRHEIITKWPAPARGMKQCRECDCVEFQRVPVGESTRDDSLAAFMERTAKELAHRTNLLDHAFSEMRRIAEEELRANTRTIDSLNSDEVQGRGQVIGGGVDRPDTPLDCKSSPVAKPACGATQHILGDGCDDCREFAELGLGESREPLQDKEKQ